MIAADSFFNLCIKRKLCGNVNSVVLFLNFLLYFINIVVIRKNIVFMYTYVYIFILFQKVKSLC